MLAALAVWWALRPAPSDQPVGLFTTLPILWAETGDVGELITAGAQPHWARGELARHGPIIALDTLLAQVEGQPDGAQPVTSGALSHAGLAGLRRLVVAQPRPLAPQENVALDRWVRGGGKVLLIVDPALTEDSAFPLGDPRRPQSTALLSPILQHWGLELTFDDGQPYGVVEHMVGGIAVPTNLSGRFVVRGAVRCRIWDAGLAVSCMIGRGRVVALADAALLERDDPAGTRRKVFSALLDTAFAAP